MIFPLTLALILDVFTGVGLAANISTNIARNRLVGISSPATNSLAVPNLMTDTLIITSTSPARNALNVALTTNVTAIFNANLNANTVTSRTFLVYSSFSGRYTQTLNYNTDDRTVILNPQGQFKPGEVVNVSTTAGIQSNEGTSLKPYLWQFTVATTGGSGQFVAHPTTPSFDGGPDTTGVALGDIDSDGDLDALFANSNNRAETVWLNDGTGSFDPHPTTPSFGAGNSMALALGIIGGDDDLDVIVANYIDDSPKIWQNDGIGGFTILQQSIFRARTSSDVTLGDLDGEGDLDALFVNTSDQFANPNQDTIWLNGLNGNASFRDFGAGDSSGAALGDLDNDGDLDAVIANYSQTETVWLNDGLGFFTPHPITPSFGGSDGVNVTLGDVDNDGDLDALVANYNNQPETVWLNDGLGNFTTFGGFGADNSLTVALGDIDGDGDLDALVVNYPQAETVWLNNGAGVFSHLNSFGTDERSFDVGLGDLDGDGDLDAIFANYDDAETVWLNQNQADLILTKSVSSASAIPGQVITYTITFSNAGELTATGTVITDSMPVEHVVSLSYTSNGATITPTDNASYTWQVANLIPGADGVITITGMVSPNLSANTDFTNTATITSITGDANPINNTSTAAVITVGPVGPTYSNYLPIIIKGD
jgi:uncharacterized repeat protein (TIGR01451 family)